MRYLFFDTETAGFNGPVLEIAAIYHRDYFNFEPTVAEYQAYLKHEYDYEISEGAFNVNGLTKEFLAENGLNPEVELRKLVASIKDVDFVIGHNLVSFDLRLIKRECQIYGIPFDYTAMDNRLICTMAASKAFCNLKDKANKIKSPNLSELYFRLFGEAFTEAHTALGDVKATAKCFFELLSRGLINIQK